MNFNLLTGRTESHLELFQTHLLHKGVIAYFSKLQKLAKKEIGADLQIISSFRSFERQKIIWDEKVTGIRKILDDNEEIIDSNLLSRDELLTRILRFSAMPGTSRHHWGTDIDIYDSHKLSKEKVELTPREWESGSPFYELGQWLNEKIQNQESFGFFRPYETDLGGVAPEKWHLSFFPLASHFQDAYSIDIFEKNIQISNFRLNDLIQHQLIELYDRFIKTISPIHWQGL